MNKNIRVLEKRKKIALIAHDNKKKDLIEWAVHNKKELSTGLTEEENKHKQIIQKESDDFDLYN